MQTLKEIIHKVLQGWYGTLHIINGMCEILVFPAAADAHGESHADELDRQLQSLTDADQDVSK